MKNSYLRVLSLGSTYTVGNVAQQALSVVLLPLYTSYLSVSDFGVLALMDLAVLLIVRPVRTPFTNAFSRFYYKPNYEKKRGIFLFNLFCILFIKSTTIAMLYWYFCGFLSDILFYNGHIYRHISQTYTFVLLLNPLAMFLLGLIVAREMAKFYVLISLIKVVLVSSVVIYLLTHLQLGILAIVYGNIFGLAFEILMAFPLLLKCSTFKFLPSIVYEPLRYGYPMILRGYSNLLMEFGDRYLLNIFTSVNSVGLYSFGYRVAQIVNILFVSPVKQSSTPVILQKENDVRDQKQLITRMSTYFYAIGVFMALGISLLAREMIMLLARQPEFWLAWTIVPIVSLSYVQLGLGSFLCWGIVLKNKSSYISGISLVGALMNVGLNLVFIPYWDILGAAASTLISYVFLNILYIHYSLKFYDIRFDIGRIVYISIIAIILYLLSLLISNEYSIYMSISIKLLFLIMYPLILFFNGFFTIEEKYHLQKLWYKNFKTLRGRLNSSS